MYLDTDIILALIKDSDWLQSEVELDEFENPRTSVVTAIEVQLVFIEDKRELAVNAKDKIAGEGIEIIPLNKEVLEESSRKLKEHRKLNVFDSIHLSHAEVLDEKIVSTDTLYPRIDEVDNVDPREM